MVRHERSEKRRGSVLVSHYELHIIKKVRRPPPVIPPPHRPQAQRFLHCDRWSDRLPQFCSRRSMKRRWLAGILRIIWHYLSFNWRCVVFGSSPKARPWRILRPWQWTRSATNGKTGSPSGCISLLRRRMWSFQRDVPIPAQQERTSGGYLYGVLKCIKLSSSF